MKLNFKKNSAILATILASSVLLSACAQENSNRVLKTVSELNLDKSDSNYDFQWADFAKNPAALNYLGARVIGLSALVQDRNQISYVNGTGTILAPADQKTVEGNGTTYYVATNIHVAKDFKQSWLSNSIDPNRSNPQILGFWFTPSNLLDSNLVNVKVPSKEQIQNKNQSFEKTFSFFRPLTNSRFLNWTSTTNYSLQPSLNLSNDLNTNNQYYPIEVDQNLFWAANNFSFANVMVQNLNGEYQTIQGPINSFPTTINSFKFNAKLAADFAIMKVNLSPTLNHFSQNQLNLTNYLSFLKKSIQTYGTINFNPKTNGAGYLVGLPSSLKQPNISGNVFKKKVTTVALATKILNDRLQSISLKTKPFATITDAQEIMLFSNNTLPLNQQASWTPTSDYLVNNLNLGAGSSGSLLINYDSSQSDLKKQFSANGIYWGVFSNDNGAIIGAISKLVDPQRYDLIGPSNPSSMIKNNSSFCSYLTTQQAKNSSVYLPLFCRTI